MDKKIEQALMNEQSRLKEIDRMLDEKLAEIERKMDEQDRIITKLKSEITALDKSKENCKKYIEKLKHEMDN